MTVAVSRSLRLALVVPRGYLPELSGGLEITADRAAQALSGLGHRLTVCAAGPFGGGAALLARVRRKLGQLYASIRIFQNYEVWLDYWHPAALDEALRNIRPDAVLAHVSHNDLMIEKLILANLPTLFYVHTYDISPVFQEITRMRRWAFAAESNFVASKISDALGCAPEIIQPIMEREKYSVPCSGSAILCVNPNYLKGGDIIVEVVRAMPHRQFLLIGAWQNYRRAEDAKLETQFSTLSNVRRVTHVEDMRAAFAQARCLFMPVRVEEAYGRSAAEAQIAGVPVVASDRGALPEVVGRAGLIQPLDSSIQEWVNALESWQKAALSQSAATERQPEFVKRKLNRLLEELAGDG
jgi:glycosyltransferase involved in cell wall biosynthesis